MAPLALQGPRPAQRMRARVRGGEGGSNNGDTVSSSGSADTVQFYIDGVPVSSTASVPGATWGTLGSQTFAIGRRCGFNVVAGYRLAGSRLYQSALTEDEVIHVRTIDHPGLFDNEVVTAANDSEAASLGCPLSGVYINSASGVLQVRLV